jgi:hypothetical protein
VLVDLHESGVPEAVATKDTAARRGNEPPGGNSARTRTWPQGSCRGRLVGRDEGKRRLRLAEGAGWGTNSRPERIETSRGCRQGE